jgi:ABC-2 family transporter protein
MIIGPPRKFHGTRDNLLPVPRPWFVVAKLLVAALWWLVIVLVVYVEAVAVGLGLGLSGITWTAAGSLLGNLLLVAGISYLLAPMVALVTVWTRGYLAPVGFALGMLLLGNVVGHTGWAPWFPWSIVPILVGSVSTPSTNCPWVAWSSWRQPSQPGSPQPCGGYRRLTTPSSSQAYVGSVAQQQVRGGDG